MAEIERKWRLAGLPPRTVLGEGVPIMQGYVFVEPETRVRKKGNRYFVAVKGEGGLSRDEWEVETEGWVFELLWPLTKGRRIEKTRYSVLHDNTMLDVDVYSGELDPLIIMECEFPSEEAACQFVEPDWAINAVDVTTNRVYKNKHLAVQGLPANV